MKITDPLLELRNFGPLRFERPDDDRVSDVFLLTVDGSVVAELAPLYEDGTIVPDEDQACLVAATGAWSLRLTRGQGRVTETYALRPTPDVAGNALRLTTELAAWATLTVLWANNSREHQSG